MRRLAARFAIVCITALIAASGCADADSARGLPVTSPTPLPLAPLAATLPVNQVAPTLSRTIVSVVLTALHRGATGSGLRSPRWSAECPGGGSARINLPDSLPFIGEVSLNDTRTAWTSCVMSVNGTPVTATGETSLSGKWSSSAPTSPITVISFFELNVDAIGREWVNLDVDGATGMFNGRIGDIPVSGVVEGPFIPRPSPAPSPVPTPAPGPVTVEPSVAAPVLGRTLTTVILQALSQGARRQSFGQPHGAFERAWTFFFPLLHAQSGRWTSDCPSGGNARIDLPDTLPYIGEVTLTNTTALYSECSMEVGAAIIAATGRVNLSGTWIATAPTSPIRMTGSVDVTPIGTQLLNIDVDAVTGVYNGQIGNIPVEAVLDGPFIPRPTPPPPVPPPAPPQGGGIAQYNGTYAGTASGFFGEQPVSLAVSFSVAGGVITVAWPGNGTGTIGAGGAANFTGSLSSIGRPGTSCGFNGAFQQIGQWPNGNPAFEATGNWTCNAQGVTGSGRWNAIQQP